MRRAWPAAVDVGAIAAAEGLMLTTRAAVRGRGAHTAPGLYLQKGINQPKRLMQLNRKKHATHLNSLQRALTPQNVSLADSVRPSSTGISARTRWGGRRVSSARSHAAVR